MNFFKIVDLWLIGNFCFNFINLFEFCIIIGLRKSHDGDREQTNKLFQSISVMKGEGGGRKISVKLKLAEKIERYMKISQPLLYMLFLVIFFTQALTTEHRAEKAGKIMRPMNEIVLNFWIIGFEFVLHIYVLIYQHKMVKAAHIRPIHALPKISILIFFFQSSTAMMARLSWLPKGEKTACTDTENMALANGRISLTCRAPMEFLYLHWAEMEDHWNFWTLANGRNLCFLLSPLWYSDTFDWFKCLVIEAYFISSLIRNMGRLWSSSQLWNWLGKVFWPCHVNVLDTWLPLDIAI